MKREPVCVLGERVWRTYLGGREIGKLHGDEKAEDSHFPEEWMYSVTRAFNAGREEIVEGLCKIAGGEYDEKTLKEYIDSDPEEILGKKHVETWGSYQNDRQQRTSYSPGASGPGNSKTTFWKSFWKNRMLAYFKYKRRLRGKAVSLSGI